MTNRLISWATLAGIVIVVLLAPATGHGSVAARTVADLTASSDVIVFGVVTDVEPVGDGPVATIHVSEVWKGVVDATVRYDVRRAWVCDTSYAQVGETAVLFLVRHTPGGAMMLAHSGRGRLVVTTIDGVQYIHARVGGLTFPDEVAVKWQLGADDRPDPWVTLADFRTYVKSKVSASG